MTDDRRSDWEAIDDALSRIPGTVEHRRRSPAPPLPSRKRPYLAMAFGAFVVGIVVALWWWLS
jgi:ferric-dicitrate binding protein FerR (iron transport regulator)